MLSVVIPVHNEEENVVRLHEELFPVVKKLADVYEIIFVDDGSTDKTLDALKKLRPVKIIAFRKNFGQTAAFDAGFKEARGDTIVSMDGDLQNDPNDIPRLLEKLDEGYDVVCGWRHPRSDKQGKIFVSFFARVLRRILLGDRLHDAGCSLRVYRKSCLEDLDLYSDLHRFIPSILAIKGFRVAEIKVHHRPRKAGKTKYNWFRSVKGLADMIAVWFWQRYHSRPMHLFGGGGLFLFTIGFGVTFYLLVIRIFFNIPLSGRILLLLSVFLMLFGIQLFVTGLLADISIRNYYRFSKKQNYFIREIIVNDRPYTK